MRTPKLFHESGATEARAIHKWKNAVCFCCSQFAAQINFFLVPRMFKREKITASNDALWNEQKYVRRWFSIAQSTVHTTQITIATQRMAEVILCSFGINNFSGCTITRFVRIRRTKQIRKWPQKPNKNLWLLANAKWIYRFYWFSERTLFCFAGWRRALFACVDSRHKNCSKPKSSEENSFWIQSVHRAAAARCIGLDGNVMQEPNWFGEQKNLCAPLVGRSMQHLINSWIMARRSFGL